MYNIAKTPTETAFFGSSLCGSFLFVILICMRTYRVAKTSL